jgi:hypothetical protein
MDSRNSVSERLLRALATLTYGWFVPGIRLIRQLCARQRDQRRIRGERHTVRCQVIPPDIYKRPDPLIYSQHYLMSQGLAVTWDNPDISLYRSGVFVPSSQLAANTEYEIRATIYNGSGSAPAINLGVDFSFLSFGIGTTSTPIGTTRVDLPVRGAPGHPVVAVMRWRTPAVPGHYCIQVNLRWNDDANPANNLGQENTNVGVAHSPSVFEFPVANPTQVREHITLEADSYTVPERIDCRDVINGRLVPADERGRTLKGEALCRALAQRHRQGQFPIPAGWTVDIVPDQFDLNGGQSQNVVVTVTPPAGFTGTHAVNINAFNAQHLLIGGVTLYTQK